jgi:hypothetical protein
VARSAILPAELDIESVRLAPGSHSSPREGVCAAELASLLGGEKFSDRPGCVCEVISAFLRSFNDRVAHAERQQLIPYADRAVGSWAEREVTHMRRDICLVWAGARPDGGPLRWLLERLTMRFRIWVAVGLRQSIRLNEGAGANGRALEAAPFPDPVQGAAKARVAAAIRQLAGDAEIAQRENGGQAADHNGHAGHLGGRDAGQRDKKDVEHDYAHNGDPERETNPAEDLHNPARVP